MMISSDVVVAILSVIVVVLVFYFAVGKLGKISTGTGTKFEAFSGGEELPPTRGKYHSELFVYAALFVAFEVMGLLLAGSIASTGFLWPLLFTLAGGFSLFILMVWFIGTGGAELA